MIVTAFRVVKRRYAATAFDGRGAAINGGRWNEIGTPMVYTSANLALATLELYVNTGDDLKSERYVFIPLRFDSGLVESPKRSHLPKRYKSIPFPVDATPPYGTRWINENRSCILRVSSAIVHQEYNYLLNPAHPDFHLVKIGRPRPFRFDPRLIERSLP